MHSATLVPIRLGVAFVTATIGALWPLASAQCSTQWLAGSGCPGVDGPSFAATTWDPDGGGPAPAVLVVGGDFVCAGNTLANRIAAYDATTGTWSTFGSGMNGSVLALATLANGDLVAGGRFSTAGGVGANCVARWDGSGWSALGQGMGGFGDLAVEALVVLPNGDLVAGGSFATAGGVAATGIARWNAVGWSPFSQGLSGRVRTLAVEPNGTLIVGGNFAAGGASHIARWSGTSWSALGSGLAAPAPSSVMVSAVTMLPNGDVVAGGSFATAGGSPANNIARWNGASWSPLGSGLGSEVWALRAMPNGDLVAGGSFVGAGGAGGNRIARWNGATWSGLGSGMPTIPYPPTTGVSVLAVLPNGDLMAGGAFHVVDGVTASGVATWNGSNWAALGPGNGLYAGSVSALETLPGGDLVAGGSFTVAGSAVANCVARWSGAAWVALGAGQFTTSALLPEVKALAVMSNGDLVAGGWFATAGGANASCIARWNGTSWSALGAGMNNGVDALVVLPNGDLVAGGAFTIAGSAAANRVARWDGATWSPLGTGVSQTPSPPFGSFAAVHCLAVLTNGDLVVGGRFTTAGGQSANNIARWDGVGWSPLGVGLPGEVRALAELPNGDLVVGGSFTGSSLNCIARWNGASWSALGSGVSLPGGAPAVTSIAVLPNSDLLVGGNFATAGGVSAVRIARWNGSAWSSAGSGADATVEAMRSQPGGDVVVGGAFASVDGVASSRTARLTTTCPAVVAVYGGGCTGTGGPNVLAASSLPWVGSTFRSLATGLTSPALAVAVIGFGTSSLPLPSILPQGVAGCTLLVSPDLLELHVASAGGAQAQVALPNDSSLAGWTLHQQVVPVELGASGDIVAVTATNALTLTIGSF